MSTGLYRFEQMTPRHLPLVAAWRRTPAVQEWWGDPDGDDIDEDDIADPRLQLWIVSLRMRPFAYIQDYDPHGWEQHLLGYLPHGSRGMDQFIGEPDLIGLGHGSAFIRQHCDALLAAGAPCVGTDPASTNTRAIRAYEKAGFAKARVCDVGSSCHQLMHRCG